MSDGDDHEIQYLEETGQVRFYLRRPIHFYVPSAVKDSGDYNPHKSLDPPDEALKLEWVYGYRGKDARNNLYSLASGEVVYFTAGVAIIYNVELNTQRYFAQHTDDIKSLAVHPDGETVATGQLKGRDDEVDAAHIRVWSSVTLETLHLFGMGDLNRGVACLAFSRRDGGALLVAVDEGQEPKLSVWDWEDSTKITDIKCSSDPVLAVTFSQEACTRIITSGKNSLVFWVLDDNSLKKRTGVFGNTPKPKYITAVAFTNTGETVTGDSNGNIAVWLKGGNEITRSVNGAHDGSIFHILALSDGGFLTSGKDRFLKHWDTKFNNSDAKTQLSEDLGGGRTVAQVGGQLVVGTITNALVKGGIEEDFSIITKGSLDEIWGLATHPSESKFLTGALDSSVTERDSSSKQINWTIEVAAGGVHSVSYSPSGGAVVIAGTTVGTLAVYDAATQELLQEHQAGDEPLQVVRFSPDGSLLAVGSRDNSVYVYETSDDFKQYTLRGVCTGHSSFIRSLDFSSDSSFIRTNSGDYELLYWRTEDCKQETDSSDLRDIEWASRTCLLCFSNFGVWPEGVDGTDLNAVAAAHQNNFVVTGDDFGKVKLFGGNTHYAYAGYKAYQGHSSHVTNVTFTRDDSRVISVGGNDCSVLQWVIV
uniref:Echinoderm microtubule-associated protein-like 2 n=1 Tax=Hirondellea gigas TaxID=1518452 RepID=A0A2P2I0X4_9CRUS